MNYVGGFIPIILYSNYFQGPAPPPGTGFMITEVTENRMVTETDNPMITE